MSIAAPVRGYEEETRASTFRPLIFEEVLMGRSRRLRRTSLVATSALTAMTAAFAGNGSSAAAGVVDPAAAAQGQQPVATGRGGAVASVDLDASRAGIAVLRQGGNAIDAAVAVASTLGVTEPYVAGPGGGGFMVIYLARQHRVVTIDGREACPAACTPKLFVENGHPLNFEAARHSGLAVGVPGMVGTWSDATRRFGALGLSADLQPAIHRALNGFRVDSTFDQETRESLDVLRAFPASRRLFLGPDGNPWPVGTTLKNPDLARTYRLLAAHGAHAFYEGPIGNAVVQTVRHPRTVAHSPLNVRPGIMTPQDLAAYAPRRPAPTRVGYRGYEIYGMAPPSSGGSTIGEALNILSGFDLSHESRALALHQYIESLRYSFADRNRYVGDPRQVAVPLRTLLSKKYAATRRCHIDRTAAHSPVPPGDPYHLHSGCAATAVGASYPDHEQSTNHIVTTDRWGNVVSYTNTIEQFAGTGMTVPGYGFLLNNEMTDFDFTPADSRVPDPNLPGAAKRPRSSMSPTIVLRDGQPAFALGSPGGATIITTVLQILLNHIDFGMSLEKAIAAPRVGNANTPTSFAEPAFLKSQVARVLHRVHNQQFTEVTGPEPIDRQIGAATGVQILGDNLFRAAAEPRRRGGGAALVVHPLH
jgi:gamma-glutamyltranspeptidase / glutathione hydrolase